MVLVEQLTMMLVLILRILFQFQNPETISMKKIRIIRIIPGIVSLPIVPMAHIQYSLRHIPGSFEPAPLSSFLILGWIAFVVIDSLYQFHMISKIPDSDTE